MKILVVGYGSIGKRHIRNLLNHTKHEIIVCSKQKNIKFSKNRGKIISDLDKSIDEKPDCAIIANNTSDHLATALKLAKANCHLLIEKPLSNSLTGLKNLENITKKNNLITLMGCNLRFHTGILMTRKLLKENTIGKILHTQVEFGSYLPDWHPGEDFRQSYAAKQALGGGAILTLIHEIDYLYWLFGDVQKILSISGTASNFKIDVEDFSSTLLEFKNKLVCILHLNYFQQPRTRQCKIIGTKGTILWDYENNHLKVYVPKKQKWIDKMKNSKFKENQMYVDELKHFFNCIKNKKSTINDISEGIEVLKIALDIKKAGKTSRVITR